ncbi:zinc finger family protein [Striga asiatica]|uniref:Zinc finger family protein n=1 Tax=Striga asiatica TaxID=4170 RepID=A0A5A7PEP5_STRAF|nr:zinc finger family protein [Striga asiatica]
MCGRALGGHMRAHGIGDESGNIDDEDPVSDWEENKFAGGVDRCSNKRMYQLRTNPNRLKSCRACKNCGKEFLSWKSFLEHGKCNSDDASESFVSSHDSGSADEDGVEDDTGGARSQWSKRKRSMRSKVGCFSATSYPPSEEDDIVLARCLVQLANTVVDQMPVADPEESCASVIREAPRNGNYTYFAPPNSTIGLFDRNKGKGIVSTTLKGMFECKACKKVFNSHQALGGHRASHKKVKGCYATKQDQIPQQHENNDTPSIDDGVMITNNEETKLSFGQSNSQFEQGPDPLVGSARRKSKVHECSICHRVFGSGQALGGHKRCHWITSNSPETSSLPKFHFQDNTTTINNNIILDQTNINHNRQPNPTVNIPDKLDLNVPAWAHVTGPLSFHVSTDMQLQPWIGPDSKNIDSGPQCQPQGFQLKNENADNNNNNNNVNGDIIGSNIVNGTVDTKSGTTRFVEDEADSKLIKLAKLSDLKEMDNSGNSSQWLQVGVGSTAEAAANV